jgi:hypothetical protein
MPTPYGRDRVAELEDGSIALSSLRPKGWTGRVETNGPSGVVTTYGTAVEWENAIWEVVRVEPMPSGGTRYVMAPWDERLVIRSYVRYPGEELPAGPLPATGSLSTTIRPAAVATTNAWKRTPSSVRTLVLGFVPGVLLGGFFPLHLMGEGMSFFVHELGHTAVALAFGRLAVPAVIMTITFDQSLLAAGLIWLAIGGLAWRLRSVRGWRLAAWAVAFAYPFVAFTFLQLDAFHLGGHLAEVIVSALFFHRAVAGGLFSEWERPVYAFFAWSLWLRNVRLFLGVATDAQARTDYLSVAITGENDLVKLANTHGFDLATVAFVAFLLSAVIPAAALVLAFRKHRAATTDWYDSRS